MSRAYPMQESFNGGELSPRLYGRTDLAKYDTGARTIQNFVVQAQGNCKKRSGTRFVREVKDSSLYTRLVPFVFSTVQAYVLEFSNNVIRVYKDEGIILDAGPPLEIVTTYTTAEIPSLQFAQSADVLYIVHEGHPAAVLTRTSDTAWTLTDVDFQDGPYLPENETATTMAPASATGSGITITASSIVGINGGVGFKSSDVGRLIRLVDSAFLGAEDDAGWAEIVTFTDTTHVVVDINSDFQDTVATTHWRLGAFGSDSELGYPTIVTFHEQRLWFGANPGAPQTVYGSQTAIFEQFGPTDLDGITIADDSAITYTIAADQVNVIRWFTPIRALLLGTSGGIWPAQASTTLEPITPSNIQIKRSTVNGGAAVQPTNVDDLAVYTSNTQRKLWSVGYEGDRDAYISSDLTLLAEHITESGIDAMAYAAEPHSIVWCVRGDGQLVGITYVRDQQVFGWHRHILGGSFDSGDAVVESIAVIPSPEGDPSSVGRDNIAHDQVWLVVKRTINGGTVRYVEFLEDDFADTDALEDAFYVDSGLTYDGVATATISGLTHLEGETVQVLVEGATHPDRTVVSGSITLEDTYTKVQIGYAHAGRVDTLNSSPEESRSAISGNTQGRMKRIPRVTLRLDRSLGGEVCSNESLTTYDPILYRAAGDPMDAPPPLFTGDKQMHLECGWSTEARMSIRHIQPLPFNLLALMPQVELSTR